MNKRTLILVILDGWGIGKLDKSNPLHVANLKNIQKIRHTYPAGTLQASGIAVGLPWGEEGNSEVGHLTIGAGKVLYQHYPRISIEIKDGKFFENRELKEAFARAKAGGGRVHFIGMLGEGNVHSSVEHIEALVKFAENEGMSDSIYMHLFTDGRDGSPKAAGELIGRIGESRVASISGRHYAMDRDLHFDRTERAFDAIIGKAPFTPLPGTITDFLRETYGKGVTDEFVPPTLVKEDGAVRAGDSIIFFNFREDSMRQMAYIFTDPMAGKSEDARPEEARAIPENLYIVSFTRYGRNINIPVAFPQDSVLNPLGKTLSDAGLVQLRIAETEKYAHVTYFFNGLAEQPFKNEYRVLIPSSGGARHDEHPEMMAKDITSRAVAAINEGVYDFILINYANPDVIGHTGNFNAAIKAVEAVDEQIGILLDATLQRGGILVITGDHGNVEVMLDPRTGAAETKHDPNPVPFYVVTTGYERTKSDDDADGIERYNTGVLSDVAPTILHLMGVQKPQDMNGVSILHLLR